MNSSTGEPLWALPADPPEAVSADGNPGNVQELRPVDVLAIRCHDLDQSPTLALIGGHVTVIGAASDLASYVQMARTTGGSYGLLTVSKSTWASWLRKV